MLACALARSLMPSIIAFALPVAGLLSVLTIFGDWRPGTATPISLLGPYAHDDRRRSWFGKTLEVLQRI